MSIPFIPDKTFKLFIYLGLALVAYSFFVNEHNSEVYNDKRMAFNVEIKKLEFEAKYLSDDLKLIHSKATDLAKEHKIENPLKIDDTSYTFTEVIEGSIERKNVSDIVAKLLKDYKNKSREFKLKDDSLSVKRYELTQLEDVISDRDEFFFVVLILGVVIFFIGLTDWVISENFEKKLLQRQNLDKPTFSENCQSCGREFDSMVRYGTEANGEKNYHFCNVCFAKGEFTNPNLTLDELKKETSKRLEGKKRSKRQVKLALKKLASLERWTY